ncbi:MAG TPA: SRPBCC family protein [Egibacteraceae bacterium]|nr:SRPBCC family protein [Egibacteraceae bacterium]
MSRTVAYVNAPVERVFEVLLDPTTYAYWVVGAKQIRAVEDAWPQPGSGFHHTVGVGPFATRDETRVVRIDEPSLLELEARAWPAGQARVRMELSGEGDRTRVVMKEEPSAGPAKRLHNPLLDALTHVRNTVALKRLARVAEGRL